MAGLPLAQDVSEPLADIVRFMGRESDNYTAEMLVKELGAVSAGRGDDSGGMRVVRDVLAAAGIPLAGVRLADGSGLSSLDRLTATAVVALLKQGLPKATSAMRSSSRWPSQALMERSRIGSGRSRPAAR